MFQFNVRTAFPTVRLQSNALPTSNVSKIQIFFRWFLPFSLEGLLSYYQGAKYKENRIMYRIIVKIHLFE